MNDSSPVVTQAARIADLINRLGRMSREMQFVDGLNPAQWEALRYLKRANTCSRTPGGIAEFLCATKGTVSQTVNALKCKGLIDCRPSEKDKRVQLLDLTPKGHDLLSRDPVHKLEEFAYDLEGEQGAQIVNGLSELLSSLQGATGAKPFGVCQTCCRHITTPEECTDGMVGKCELTGEDLCSDASTRICTNFKKVE